MKSKLILICMAMMAVLNIRAAQNQALVLVMHSGEHYVFQMNERPNISVKGDTWVITTQSATISVAATDASHFYFSDGATSVDKLAKAPALTVQGGVLRLSNIQKGESVQLFDVAGKLLASQRAGRTGQLSFPAPAKGGVYVIKQGNHAFKVQL